MEKKLSVPSLQLFRQLVKHGHRTAVVTSQTGYSLTYREILREATRVSAMLERTAGLLSSSPTPSSSRPIALLAPRDHSFCVGHIAVLQAGAAVVPIHSHNPPAETEFILRDAGCRQILLHPQLRSAVEPLLHGAKGLHDVKIVDLLVDESRALDADTLPSYAVAQGNKHTAASRSATQDLEWFEMSESADAMIVYTSGTTGRPKGVVKTHAQLAEMCRAVVEAWAYTPTDRVLEFLPLHHLHGLLNKFLAVLWAGGVVEFLGSPAAAAIWQRLADPTKPPLTMFHAVPTIYSLMLDELESDRLDGASQANALQHLREMRLMVSGSAALPQSRFFEWEALTGHRLLERYGTTEAGMILGNSLTPVSARFPGYVGTPFPNVEVRLVDPDTGTDVTRKPGEQGEVRVRSPEGLFSRYLNQPEATCQAFDDEHWYKTGDMGEFDSDKGFKILGRLSADILKSGGYKLSALEIEASIEEHERVAEVSIVGRPHPQWGDEVVAVVRLKEGGKEGEEDSSSSNSLNTELTMEDLRTFLAGRLAPYKMPRVLHVVKSLPKNAMGKVNKKTLLKDLGIIDEGKM